MQISNSPSAPIIIAAPTQRCGTTLIQRAINSTKKAIIFGENFVLCEKIPSIYAGISQNKQLKLSKTSEAMRRLQSGLYNEDMSSLYPNYEKYLDVILENFERIVQFYDQESRRSGYSRWGIKNQVRDMRGFAQFTAMASRAKFVVLYRDVMDVIKSHKARFPDDLVDLQSIANYANRWSQNVHALRSAQSDRYLHIEYRDLIKNTDFWIKKIENHFALDGIDRSVFEKKVNVSPVTDNLSSDEATSHYRQPASLSDDEIRIVKHVAGSTARHLGYDWAM